MEKVEVFPKIQIDEGEERKQVIFGGARASRFIKEVVAGKHVDGKRYQFNSGFVMEIHNRVSMAPGVKGFLRQTDSTRVGGESVKAHWEELPWMFPLFGRWLEEQMERLRNDPENIVMALEIATAAHYGLTMPEFHPFDNGNGRTARALMNAVLMSQSYELTAFGMAIPPIPIIRTEKDSGHYIRSLRAVGHTRTLNPFMTFIAQKWIESLDERLGIIRTHFKVPKTKADQLLIEKLENRRVLLQNFVKSGSRENGKSYRSYPIPDYFTPRYVKVSHAETL